MVEQLGRHLSDDDLCVILDRTRVLLENTQNISLRNRMTDCAYNALSRFHAFRPAWTTFSLRETLLRQEARFIQMAIEEAGGVISRVSELFRNAL